MKHFFLNTIKITFPQGQSTTHSDVDRIVFRLPDFYNSSH